MQLLTHYWNIYHVVYNQYLPNGYPTAILLLGIAKRPKIERNFILNKNTLIFGSCDSFILSIFNEYMLLIVKIYLLWQNEICFMTKRCARKYINSLGLHFSITLSFQNIYIYILFTISQYHETCSKEPCRFCCLLVNILGFK